MTNGKITIFDAINEATKKLKVNPTIETPRLDAEVLLCRMLKCERIKLILDMNKILSNDAYVIYKTLIERRILNEPVSYITGVKEFMSLEFEISDGILIPRPDTEILVEKIIEIFKDKPAKILDLCTGSGAIAVSLAYYLKKSDVFAIDKYAKCVDTTKKNAQKNNVDVTVIMADVFEEFSFNTQFDCIVSNPPYIESKTIKTLPPDVKKFEPIYALDGGEDGLEFYRRLTEIAVYHLKPGGILAYEIGYNQAKTVSEIIARTNSFGNIEIVNDLSGNNRVIIVEKR